jgi:hypothetical protein
MALRNLFRRLRRKTPTPEDIAARHEAGRISDEIASTQLGAKTQAGENYMTQRRTRY